MFFECYVPTFICCRPTISSTHSNFKHYKLDMYDYNYQKFTSTPKNITKNNQ